MTEFACISIKRKLGSKTKFITLQSIDSEVVCYTDNELVEKINNKSINVSNIKILSNNKIIRNSKPKLLIDSREKENAAKSMIDVIDNYFNKYKKYLLITEYIVDNTYYNEIFSFKIFINKRDIHKSACISVRTNENGGHILEVQARYGNEIRMEIFDYTMEGLEELLKFLEIK